MSRHPRTRALARNPTVTVVMPCFNYGHHVPFALASVLEQRDVDVDVIAIDDASPDGSGEVLRELATLNPRVSAILHQRNQGHIATYNEGLSLATGEYVVLLSADDALTPGALARATALLDAESSVGFAYGFPVHFDGQPPPAGGKVRSWTVWRGEEWIGQRCRRGDNCIASPEVVMRASVQRAIGGYDPNLPLSGDLEMWLRAAAVADVGRVNGPDQAYYRVHHKSMQRTVQSGFMNELEGRLAAFEKVLLDPGAKLTRADRMLSDARRRLADLAIARAYRAFDQGDVELEPVQEYLAFAQRVWPAAEQHRKFKRVHQRIAAGHPRADRDVTAPARRFADDLAGRLRWRRWRWSGV